MTLHLFSKPALIVVNLVYLITVGIHTDGGTADILGLNQTGDLKATGA